MLKSRGESSLNIEQESRLVESREMALDKLEILMDPEFRDFGVRFVNMGEYEQILKTGSFESREISVPQFWRDNGMAPTFQEYLAMAKKDWIAEASSETNWGSSTLGMHVYRTMLDLLKLAHREQAGEVDSKDIRRATLHRLRELLLDPNRDKRATMFARMSLSEVHPRSYLPIVREFFQDPDTFDTAEKFRALVKALAAQPLDPADAFNASHQRQRRQYELALIVSTEAIAMKGSYSWGNKSWKFLKQAKPGELTAQHLLAAVAILPEKSIGEQAVALSKSAGPFAHPIFRHTGTVQFPR